MKLNELTEAIAATCNVRTNVVSQVQTETFRAVRAALDKGDKVLIPGFGIFTIKDIEGENGAPGKKVVRFRARSGDKEKEGKGGKGKKANKNGANDSGDDGDED